MSDWKMPPKAKVFEAFSAVADERVEITGPTSAIVTSSAGDKTYNVDWSEDGSTINSNDNASYWQGYLGYPIIAVLIATKRIVVSDDVLHDLTGINWNALNKEHKRNYDAAVESALEELRDKGRSPDPIVNAADRVFEELAALNLKRWKKRKRPPQAKKKADTGSDGQLDFGTKMEQ